MTALDGASLLDFLDAPVVVGDPTGRVIYVNGAFERAFRCERESVRGEELATIFSGGAREAVLKAVAEVCAEGRSDVLRVREDGQGYLGRVSPIETGDDRVGVIILLAEEPEADERVLTYYREMSEPLAQVTGILEELLEQTGGRRDERYRSLAEEGMAAAQRATKWSDELSRLLSGEHGSIASEVSLDAVRVLRDVRSRVDARFGAANVHLEVLARSRLPEATGDGELLQSALVRLLMHRLAGASSGSWVTLSARTMGSGPEGSLIVSVIDPLRGRRAAGAEVAAEPRSVRQSVSVIGGRMKTFVDPIAGRATVIALPLARS